jgi:DNA invertase Pin-like site-specific DNA recombinase
VLAVIGAVGQAEREAMLERQREGIDKAKREGRYKGARRQAAEVARLKAEGVTASAIARRLGIGRASVYRVLGEQEKAPTLSECKVLAHQVAVAVGASRADNRPFAHRLITGCAAAVS